MLPNLMRKTLRDDRRALLGWATGLVAFVLVYVGFYPQFKDQLVSAKMEAMPAGMKEFMGLREVGTATGYLEMTVYSLVGPLLLIMVAIVLGVRAVAGPEENHTLELLLANPISRRRFLLERFATLVLEVVALGAVPWLLVLLLANAFDMGIPASHVSSTSLGLLLLALAFGTIAFSVGAFVGRRATALAVAGGAAVGSYVLHGLAKQVSSLEPLRWLSPFQYYIGDDPLRTGFHAASILVPLALVGVLLALAAYGFERRDLAA